MEHTLAHAGLTFVAPASDGLAPVAGAVLRYLSQLVDEDVDLPDGTVLGFFWWPLLLRREGDQITVLPPEGFGDDLSIVLGLFSLQAAIARRVGVEPVGHEPDQVVHIAPGAIEATEVMLQRAPTADPGATGWYVRPDGPLTGYDDDYTTITLAELTRQRPGLMTPLALPPMLLVRMRGDVVTSVLGADKSERLT